MNQTKPITKESFNKVSGHPLQSWEWGEFRKAWGNELVRFPFGQVTITKIPHLPYKIGVFYKGPTPTRDVIREVNNFAKESHLIFVKFEPNVLGDTRLREKMIDLGLVKGRRIFTNETFLIDLSKSEEDLLKGFSSKTRYNIRLAQKHGVEVVEDNSDFAFERYLTLTKETSRRQNFFAHSKKYHKLMWKTLNTDMVKHGESPIARLITARYKGEIITTWIIFVWNNALYYPYGASTNKHKEVMANNLMMWEAIKLGKKLGLTKFDLWGKEEGKGFTKFKEGYNPKVVEFVGSWDLPVLPLVYRVYRIAEELRWYLLKTASKVGLSKPRF